MKKLGFTVLALSLLAGTAASAAQSWYYTKTTYYSDATKTVVVGRITDLCNGETITMGIVTPYYNVDTGSCP